jgi:hypothetical protein
MSSVFLGHRIAKDDKSIHERQTSEKGYISSDLPLLNELGILRNKKIKAQPNEIRDFLHWLSGNRNVPLPPLARRILCLKRALINQSILSVDTPTEQRTRQQNQISEIDEILTNDGLNTDTIKDENKCMTSSSVYVSPIPLPEIPDKAESTIVAGEESRPGGCPPPVMQCVCNGSPAKISELQSQIKSLEVLVREIQKQGITTTTSTQTTNISNSNTNIKTKTKQSIQWKYVHAKSDGLCFYHSLYNAAKNYPDPIVFNNLLDALTLESARTNTAWNIDNEQRVVIAFREYIATQLKTIENVDVYLNTLVKGNKFVIQHFNHIPSKEEIVIFYSSVVQQKNAANKKLVGINTSRTEYEQVYQILSDIVADTTLWNIYMDFFVSISQSDVNIEQQKQVFMNKISEYLMPKQNQTVFPFYTEIERSIVDKALESAHIQLNILTPADEWSKDIEYTLNKQIQYNGIIYRSSIPSNKGNIPSVSSTAWKIVGPHYLTTDEGKPILYLHYLSKVHYNYWIPADNMSNNRDDLIQDLVSRLHLLIESANDSSNKNALRKYTNEVIERLENLYKLLLSKKSIYKDLLEIINGLNISSFTGEDFETYLKTEQQWIENLVKILHEYGEDESKINDIISIFILNEDAKKEIIDKNNYDDFFNTRKEILQGLIKVAFEQLLVVKEKSCDEAVIVERKKCDDTVDKLRKEYEERIRSLEEQLEKCKEEMKKPAAAIEPVQPTVVPMSNANELRRNSGASAVITPLSAEEERLAAIEPIQPIVEPMNNTNELRRNSGASAVITPLSAEEQRLAAIEPVQTTVEPMNNTNELRRNSGASAVITPLSAEEERLAAIEPIQPIVEPMNNTNELRRNSGASAVIIPLSAEEQRLAAIEPVQPTVEPMNNTNELRRNSGASAVITPLSAEEERPAAIEPVQPIVEPMSNTNELRRNSGASAVITPLSAEEERPAAIEPLQPIVEPMNGANDLRRNSGASAVIMPLSAEEERPAMIEPLQPIVEPMNSANDLRRNSGASAVIMPLSAEEERPAAIEPVQPIVEQMSNANELRRNSGASAVITPLSAEEGVHSRRLAKKPHEISVEKPASKDKPFYPAGPGPHAKPILKPEPVIRPRPMRSFIDDLKSLQYVKSQILSALKGLFINTKDKDKLTIKNELQDMLTYLTSYYFTTSTPENNLTAIDIISDLLKNERYHNILVNPTGSEIINISMNAALQRKVTPKDIISWNESQALMKPEDSGSLKLKKHNYTKIMVKKILLYLLNEMPLTRGGGGTRRKNKKSQRKTRRRR